MIIETMLDSANHVTRYIDDRYPGEWLTALELHVRTAEEERFRAAHISPLVPAQHDSIADKVATDIGVRVTAIAHSDGVQGYIINGKRSNGVACNTAVFPDSTSPADQLLFALIKELQNG